MNCGVAGQLLHICIYSINASANCLEEIMCSAYSSLASYGLQTVSAANRASTDAPRVGRGLGHRGARWGGPTPLVAIRDGGCRQHPMTLLRAPHQPSPCCKDGSTPPGAAASGWKDQPPRLDPAGSHPRCSLQWRVSPRGCILPPRCLHPMLPAPRATRPGSGSASRRQQRSSCRGCHSQAELVSAQPAAWLEDSSDIFYQPN